MWSTHQRNVASLVLRGEPPREDVLHNRPGHRDPGKIRSWSAGMNVARPNFSHGTMLSTRGLLHGQAGQR
jgi:hypothetical protein